MELSEDPKGDWRDEIKLSNNNTMALQEIFPRSSQFVAQSGWIMSRLLSVSSSCTRYQPVAFSFTKLLNVLQRDGTDWVNLFLDDVRDLKRMEERQEHWRLQCASLRAKFFIPLGRFKMYYNGTNHPGLLMASGISINPRSWCHQCTNINTRSGIILIIYE